MPPRKDDFDPDILEQKDEEINSTFQRNRNRVIANNNGEIVEKNQISEPEFKSEIVWRNIILFIVLHTGAFYGIYLCFYAKPVTLLFAFLLYLCGGLGITAGAHRLWAHRTYKAKLPLRILLGLFQTLAVQNSIYEWSRDHRVHHKHTETDADPHNATRGFFFAHIGWLLMRKHPQVVEKGRKIPLDDLLEDPVVYWQKKYYRSLAILISFVLPTIIPVVCWNESISVAYFVPAILRYVLTLHLTWLVNSLAHMIGYKPYDKRINPVENFLVSIGAFGEGFHNYHHTFPQDYATSEYGSIYFNLTKGFIDFMAFIGQAYDRKKISDEIILQRRKRTGNLSHSHSPNEDHAY